MRAALIPSIGLLAVVGCTGGDDGKDPTTPGTTDTGTYTYITPITTQDDDDDTVGDDDDDTTTPGVCDPAAAPFYDQAGNLLQTYDCNALDRCTETDIKYFTACCNCEVQYCNEPQPPCEEPPPTGLSTGCMNCHNGTVTGNEDYSGGGLSNPHPFGGAAYISCVTCHGGDGTQASKINAHVPIPPWLGDDTNLINNPESYFNFLTLVGIDKRLDPYTGPSGATYTGMDWLQFRNPGDLRIIAQGKSCGAGGCHGGEHADWVLRSPLATEVGFYSATMYSVGIDNYYADRRNDTYWGQTGADYAFRDVSDPNYTFNAANVGAVASLKEFPEHAKWGDTSGMYDNTTYDANILPTMVYAANEENGTRTNNIKAGTPLSNLIREVVAGNCGDCHLGSAGANNRYADFRSSGCTACHMQYAMDGRTNSTDPNVDRYEPYNPDAIAAPERPHIDSHQIRNVAKILPNGAFVRGITDQACVGCHQGSNRTVLQYWGIRLDQNADLTNNFQYPANPNTFVNTAADTRIFDPAVQNNTFNGRNANQYILFEDYDADNRDDTPPDIHYELGLGCIDCHGDRDLHNGMEGDPTSGRIQSREDQAVKVECESCHGDEQSEAYTTTCEDYAGATVTCAMDRAGNPLRHVTKDATGAWWLVSRVDGQRHYVPQTIDVIRDTNKTHPITGQEVYTPIGSYAMGRADGNVATGVGPMQLDPNLVSNGFSHMDNLDCTSCHSSWQNNCIGCHLDGFYDENPQNYFFSNTTGDRIVHNFAANFTYQNPVVFTLMVGSRNLVTEGQSGMKMFYRYTDYAGNTSDTLAFSDLNGNGNNPNIGGRGAFGALPHNRIRSHSTRGRVDNYNEGPKYCVACHLTTNSVANFPEYPDFFAAYQDRDYAAIDALAFGNTGLTGLAGLAVLTGTNTGNQNDNPYYVHMAAGLGTALFLFDANGCPVNPVDANANRFFCQGVAPADQFDINNVAYDLDRIVEYNGVANASTAHPMLEAAFTTLRQGALQPNLAGPLGAGMISKLADPNFAVVLDSWIDADGNDQGGANQFLVY